MSQQSGMSQIWAIARKELRGYFHSPVALIFLFVFLAAVLYLVFWHERFFPRGIADVRPLFSWLPRLLIILVASLTMKLWSEEHKTGTIELLLTLPVPIHRVVVGKFVAALLLVALALGATLGIPISTSFLGELDWGPVFASYLAALLLAGAYISIGLTVSSATSNQIVAFVLTVLFCTIFYLPGADAVAGTLGYGAAEILREIAIGSRFDSVTRGVIVLRDVAYWLSIIGLFLFINTAILRARQWSRGPRSAPQRFNTKLTVALLVANAIALNIWLSPVRTARIDLTEANQFTLSDVTTDLLKSVDEPLLIRGYFSQESHPKLTQLIPQIRDRLAEYKAAGGDMVRLEFVDPDEDPELQKEAKEQYKIESFPFEYADQRQRKITNAYFHILLEYGDQHEVLSFGDLIEVTPNPSGTDFDVQLRNLEYDLTKSVKRVVYGFASPEAMFAKMTKKANLTFVISPELMTRPELAQMAELVRKSAQAFAERSGNKVLFKELPAPTTQEEAEKLYEEVGVLPVQQSPPLYFTLALSSGGRVATIPVLQLEEPDATALRDAMFEALERTAPGVLKTVGFVIPQMKRLETHGLPGQPATAPPAQEFKLIQRAFESTYQVREVSLSKGHVEDDVDILVVAGPEAIDATGQKAIDQYLMRGGAVIILAGSHRVRWGGSGFEAERVFSGLESMLEHYGVAIQPQMLLDQENLELQQKLPTGIQRLPYPFFAVVGRDQMADTHLATGGLNSLLLAWASPLAVMIPLAEEEDGAEAAADDGGEDQPAKDARATVLLWSSPKSWASDSPKTSADFSAYPESGFEPAPAETKSFPLAVAITGSLTSFVAKDGAADAAGEKLFTRSPADTRLVVIGSSAFLTDQAIEIFNALQLPEERANVTLLYNLLDWAVADTDLLSIRSRGGRTRVLRVEADEALKWQIINCAIAAALLGLVFAFSVFGRRMPAPLPHAATATTRPGEARAAAPQTSDSDSGGDSGDDDEGDGDDSDEKGEPA